MNKKAIAILGAIFILIVGTLGFLIYSQSKNNSSTDNTGTNPNLVVDQTNNIDTGEMTNPNPAQNNSSSTGSSFVKLLDEQIVSPVLTFDGSGIAYFDKQGRLFRATFSVGSNPLYFSEKKQLVIEQKANIHRILWPPNSNSFMVEYLNSGKKTWEYFDNSLGQFISIPSGVNSLSFLPSGDKIYYVWSNTDKHDTVNIAEPTTKNYKTLSDIWDKNAEVYVSPDGMNIVYHQNPMLNSTITNPIVLTDIEGKSWRKIVPEGFNSGIQWSPDGKKFVFGKKDPVSQKYQLWYYDISTNETKNLGMFTTPEKVVWAKDSQILFAAVPTVGTAEGGGLTLDTFYRINVITLERKEYNPAAQQIDGREMFLSADGGRLFIKNAQDGGLYYLDIN